MLKYHWVLFNYSFWKKKPFAFWISCKRSRMLKIQLKTWMCAFLLHTFETLSLRIRKSPTAISQEPISILKLVMKKHHKLKWRIPCQLLIRVRHSRYRCWRQPRQGLLEKDNLFTPRDRNRKWKSQPTIFIGRRTQSSFVSVVWQHLQQLLLVFETPARCHQHKGESVQIQTKFVKFTTSAKVATSSTNMVKLRSILIL